MRKDLHKSKLLTKNKEHALDASKVFLVSEAILRHCKKTNAKIENINSNLEDYLVGNH